jgi:Predicted permease.
LEDKLSVVFYDGGYSQLEAGINQMKVLSLVFLAMGIILMIFIIILFTNIYISNNIFTTMIERTLGITKVKCLMSLLAGVVLIIVIGGFAGGIIGGVASGKFAESSTFEDYYNRDFSRNIISLSDKELEEIDALTTTKQMTIVYTGLSISILIIFGISVAFFKAINNIKQEPLKLLSARKE